jgi:ankyrin repeat protein
VRLRQNRSSARKQAVLPVEGGLVREWLAAAERGDLSSLKRHLANEPRLVDALGRGPYWEGDCRALHYAAYRGHRRVIRWLLARGASVRPITGDGDWAPLHFAAVPAKRDIVRLFLDRGAQMDIFTAAVLGNVSVVRRMLRNDPTLVSSRGPDGATPLHFSGSPAVAKVLLAAGADPEARDRFHKGTPLAWVIDRPRVAAVIAKAGAGIDIPLACAIGDLRQVRALLRKNPNAINAKVTGKRKVVGAEGETPLGIAARHGHRNVVGFLLAHGALAASHPSPLPGAVHRGDRLIVRQLIRAGADPNAFGPHGHAALHAAAVYGNLAMIRLLLSSGARLDLKDKTFDSTPIGWAAHHKHEHAVRILRAREG